MRRNDVKCDRSGCEVCGHVRVYPVPAPRDITQAIPWHEEAAPSGWLVIKGAGTLDRHLCKECAAKFETWLRAVLSPTKTEATP